MTKISVVRQVFHRNVEDSSIVSIDKQLRSFVNDVVRLASVSLVSIQQTNRDYIEKGNSSTYTIWVEFLITFSGTESITPLNEIPFNELKINDSLISANGLMGHIVELHNNLQYKGDDPENLMITMQWTGKDQLSQQCWCFIDRVMYIGKDVTS